MNLSIDLEPFDSPDARRLVAELDGGLAAAYRPEQRFGPRFDGSQIRNGRAAFFVARVDGEAAGCGAYMLLDGDTAEIKRMYVQPRNRGQGVARAVLDRLEAEARARGARRFVLETGVHQVEAIGLYERAGYRRVDCWGDYAASPTSVCDETAAG